MAKCPKPECESTEFEETSIQIDGAGGTYVIVCKHCGALIGIAPREIKKILDESKSRR